MITIIFGQIGAGKTSLLTFILNSFAFDKERNRLMRTEIKAEMARLGRELTNFVAEGYTVSAEGDYFLVSAE